MDIQNKRRLKALALTLATVVVSTSFYFFDQSASFIRTSVLNYPEHADFDGTTYPVQKVPDWVHLGSEKWDYSYSQLSSSDLIDIPVYDPNELRKSTDSLVWGNSADDMIRNAKITYSVPYMGNYLLDGKEYAGSHLAVDLKIPEGTPIYAIANGTVIKVSDQTSGFGHHVVIVHNNFPTLENANANETIYSSYSHLGDLMVSEGDIVVKGEQIANSGYTGTATTPHLHFQIDNDDAPWHPFWPFTWQEASDAGLDFFSAVNAGLGQDKGIATTIHPLNYVQTYLDDAVTYSEGPDADSYVEEEVVTEEEDVTVTEDVEVVEDEDEVIVEEVIEEVVLDPPVLEFVFETRSSYYEGAENNFEVMLRDQYGDIFSDGYTGDVVITSTNGHVTPDHAILRTTDFNYDEMFYNSIGRIRGEGKDRFEIEYNGETYYSEWFDLSMSDNEISFVDVAPDHQYYEAIIYLAKEGIVVGYSNETFKPSMPVTRVEALKFILEGINATTSEGDLPFTDVSRSEWYNMYLYTAHELGIVDGNPDGTFRPSDVVNKAEFYKILFNGMGIDINPVVEEDPFKDVSTDDWYAPFVAYAKEIGLIKPEVTTLNPERGMSRGEVSYAIWKLMTIE